VLTRLLIHGPDAEQELVFQGKLDDIYDTHTNLFFLNGTD